MLLIILIATYLLSAFLTDTRWSTWISDAQILLFSATSLIALRNSPMRRHTARLVLGIGIVVSVVLMVLAALQGGDVGIGIAKLWAGVLLLLTVMLLVRQILYMPEVTGQSIFGAISAYLIIGLMFASFYAAMYYLNGRQFFANGRPGTNSNFQYFSFTTLTTLGYGDFTAANSSGQAVAMIEAMTGQIFLATLVAKLVATFRPVARGAADQEDTGSRGR